MAKRGVVRRTSPKSLRRCSTILKNTSQRTSSKRLNAASKVVSKTTPKKISKSKRPNDLSQLKELKDYVALAVVDSKKYQDTNINIIQSLVKEGIPGVYVTLNKPYENVKELFAKERIDTRNIIFIDAVTKTAGGKVEKRNDCLYIGGPKNLSDLSIAMDQAIMAIPGKDKFLFFDSLSTLLLYNDVRIVAKFVHFISSKMRVWKVKGIIISLRRTRDRELIEELQPFCDVILDL